MNNLKHKFQDLGKRLIEETFADVAFKVTYVQPFSESYDVETGMLVSSTNTFNIDAIMGPFQRNLIDAQDILATDVSCIISFTTLNENLNGVMPKAQVDFIINEDGVEYDIISVSKDIAEATYSLQLRVTNE